MNFNLDFKALAYPASNLSNPVSPCQCSLVFRCDDAAREATVLLVARIPTAHDTQAFALQYDADRLLSGTVSLSSGSNSIPRSQLDGLLRNKDNKHCDIKTLALSVAQPSPLWCPDARSFGPKPGCEPSFRQFVELAKATTIHIIFDYKHVRKEHQGMFRAFSKTARGLVGYPIEASLTEQGLRKASWEVFGPVDAVGAPPAYDNSRKRPRQASPSSSNQSPKRFAPQSPTESHSSEKTVPFSPATAAEAFERALRKASPEFDYQAETINAAVSKQLPAYLQAGAINAAIDKQLPAYLDKALPALLPNILETLLAGSRSTPTSPATSIDSRGNRQPKLPPLTPLGKSLIPHLRTHLAEQFQQYQAHQLQRFQRLVDEKLAELWDSAYDARAHETAEMMEEMEEHKTEISLLKEDTLNDLSAQAGEVFAKGKEECFELSDELSDALGERLWSVFGEVCDRIDRVKRVRLKKMMAIEVSRQKRGVPHGVGKSLVRGEQRLLGRKREAELEWVDC